MEPCQIPRGFFPLGQHPCAALRDASDPEEDGDQDQGPSFPDAEVQDPDLEEIADSEFPAYFSERDGRLFHSHGPSPYPLPVDTPEQERQNLSHALLFELMGGHYPDSCPVAEVLAHDPERTKYALDLCTGTGKWTMDMAHNLPHVAFRALDIVPIATRYPHRNVQFSMHDVNTRTVWPDATFDFIHARSVTMAVTSYPALLAEVARLLRPGGLFLSGEWGRYPAFHQAPTTNGTPTTTANANGTPAPAPIPGLTAFFTHLHAALAARGLHPTAPPLAPLLAQTQTLTQTQTADGATATAAAFTEITARAYYMPVGEWPPSPTLRSLGAAYRTGYIRYLASVRPLLADSGVPEAELDEVYTRAERELNEVEGLLSVFHTVHARRV